MGLLFLIIGLIMPRFTIVILWLASTWFEGVFDTRLWPILGFLFLPITLLWYSAVENWYGGVWSPWHIGFLVLAVFLDITSSAKGRKGE